MELLIFSQLLQDIFVVLQQEGTFQRFQNRKNIKNEWPNLKNSNQIHSCQWTESLENIIKSPGLITKNISVKKQKSHFSRAA